MSDSDKSDDKGSEKKLKSEKKSDSKKDLGNEKIASKRHQILAAIALIPVLCSLSRPPNFKGLIFTLFIINYLLHNRKDETACHTVNSFTVIQRLEFVGLFVGCGMIVQLLDYIAFLSFSQGGSWHSTWLNFPSGDLTLQFTMTFRTMVALALAWLVALRLWVFNEEEIIKVTAFFGLVAALFEYQITSLESLNSLINIETIAASAIYYGSIAGIASTPLALNYKLADKKLQFKTKYVLTFFMLLLALRAVGAFALYPF